MKKQTKKTTGLKQLIKVFKRSKDDILFKTDSYKKYEKKMNKESK